MHKNNSSGSRALRALHGFVLISGVLMISQMLLAGKQAAKHAEARVIYSGQFKGHVEPCG